MAFVSLSDRKEWRSIPIEDLAACALELREWLLVDFDTWFAQVTAGLVDEIEFRLLDVTNVT